LADFGDPEAQTDADVRHQAVLGLLLVAVIVGGPAFIAAVAFAARLVRAGAVFVVIAALLGALILPLAVNTQRQLTPPPEAPGPPGACQEHSGSDTRCPGG
jgi:ABC-type enterobactin transport system permease subunit